MSYLHDGFKVTLENYKKFYESDNYSSDILDEIRLAVLDDTPIAPLIEACRNDSYRLGQLRIALREHLDPDFIKTSLSGAVLHQLRLATQQGAELSCLKRYIPKNNQATILSDEDFITLIQTVTEGVDISRVDFSCVPTGDIATYCMGLKRNYPVWLLVGHRIPKEKLKLIFNMMTKGIDIQPFLTEDWTASQLLSIISSVPASKVPVLMQYITSKFSVEQLEYIARALQFNLDIGLLAQCNEDGEPVYNSYQMDALCTAMENGVLSDDMCDPYLSDYEIRLRVRNAVNVKLQHSLNAETAKPEPVLSGTLPNKSD